MPIGGLLGGMVEYQATQQDLRDKEQLARQRELHTQQGLMELDKQRRVQGLLGQVFSGSSPQEAGESDDQRSIKQMEVASRLLMPIDPKMGLDMSYKATEMRRRAALAADTNLRAAAKGREAQGAILGSIVEADTPEAYEEGMKQYFEAGGPRPAWFTGDYAQDRPRVEQLSRSLMTTSNQIKSNANAAREESKDAELSLRERKLQQDLLLAQERLKFYRDKQAATEEHWEELEQNKDRRAADKQANGGAGSATSRRFAARVIADGGEAAQALETIISSPFETGGMFGGQGKMEGLFSEGAKEFVAKKLTPESQQRLDIIQTGLSRAISMTVNMGLAPSESEVKQFERLRVAPGDTVGTAQLKIAQQAQIIRNAMKGVKAMQLGDDQKEVIAEINNRLTSIPEIKELQGKYYKGVQKPSLADTEFRTATGAKAKMREPENKPQGLPTVKTDADFDKLPTGAEFVDQHGNKWRKP